jgi:hypothetical protein
LDAVTVFALSVVPAPVKMTPVPDSEVKIYGVFTILTGKGICQLILDAERV